MAKINFYERSKTHRDRMNAINLAKKFKEKKYQSGKNTIIPLYKQKGDNLGYNNDREL